MNLFFFSRPARPDNFYAQLKTLLKDTIRDAKTRNLIGAALLANLAVWAGGIFVNVRTSEEVIALHHNVYFGITLIGSPRQLYLIPLLGLFVIAANLVISRLTRRRDNFSETTWNG